MKYIALLLLTVTQTQASYLSSQAKQRSYNQMGAECEVGTTEESSATDLEATDLEATDLDLEDYDDNGQAPRAQRPGANQYLGAKVGNFGINQNYEGNRGQAPCNSPQINQSNFGDYGRVD